MWDISGDSSEDTGPLSQWPASLLMLAVHLGGLFPLPGSACTGWGAGKAGRRLQGAGGQAGGQDDPLPTLTMPPTFVLSDGKTKAGRRGKSG